MKRGIQLNGGDTGDADPSWPTEKGNKLYGKGDFCSAIDAFTKALRADETRGPSLGGRAACYLHLNEGSNDCLATLDERGHLGTFRQGTQTGEVSHEDTHSLGIGILPAWKV
jgi:hypothetical protein